MGSDEKAYLGETDVPPGSCPASVSLAPLCSIVLQVYSSDTKESVSFSSSSGDRHDPSALVSETTIQPPFSVFFWSIAKNRYATRDRDLICDGRLDEPSSPGLSRDIQILTLEEVHMKI
jgi:hypothetical protein